MRHDGVPVSARRGGVSRFQVVSSVAGCAAVLLAGACGGSAPAPASSGPSVIAPLGLPAELATLPVVGAIARRLPVSHQPVGMTYAFGRLWIGSMGGDITEIDPGSGVLTRTIRAGSSPVSLLAAAGALWVADYAESQVRRVDPRTGAVVATLQAGLHPISAVMVGRDIWVFNQGDLTATVIDPRTNRVLRTARTGVGAGFARVVGDAVWVPDYLGGSNAVHILDGRTGARRRTVSTGQGPVETAAGFGSGWSADTGGGTVTRFDPAAGRVQATIDIPDGQPQGLAVGSAAVWVASDGGDYLARIDPRSDRLTGVVPVGVSPRDVVIVGNDLWVDNFDEDTVVQIRLTR